MGKSEQLIIDDDAGKWELLRRLTYHKSAKYSTIDTKHQVKLENVAINKKITSRRVCFGSCVIDLNLNPKPQIRFHSRKSPDMIHDSQSTFWPLKLDSITTHSNLFTWCLSELKDERNAISFRNSAELFELDFYHS